MKARLLAIVLALLFHPILAGAEDPAPASPAATYRTDSANPQLPWYKIKPGEFPPIGSEHRVRGELVAADFIHRSGQFRAETGGKLVSFTLLPYSLVYYLNAEADLRDVPLGTRAVFYLYQDDKGEFTKAAVIQDDATKLGDHGLENASNDSDKSDKNDAAGQATEAQRKKHTAFLKLRGLAAQIDRVEGKKLVVTLFGDPVGLAMLFKDEGIVSEQWAKEHREVRAVVANEELRTYNPPVDNEGSNIISFQQLPTTGYGCGGVQWTIEPRLLLEGFRKGRIIRIFAPAWPMDDMPFGETLYTERPGAKMEEESINQYSYRTDFGNEQLPWYQLKPATFPPFQSQHTVIGELLKVDANHRAGQFRADETGAIVDFTMPPFGTILYLNAEAELAHLPLGRRYIFSLYQDEKGSFTRAAVLVDDYTRLSGETLTCRVEAVKVNEGKILLADQLAPMKDDKDHVVQPPDLAHGEFGIGNDTRVWKSDKQVALADIAPGDNLLVNLSGCMETTRSRCTDIWIGLDTHKRISDERKTQHADLIKKNGMPGWIESVEGNAVTISFFAGRRRDFLDIKQGEPWGQPISVKLADDDLRPINDHLDAWRLKGNIPETNTFGTYGSAGVRWVLELDHLPAGYAKGRCVRVFKPEWLAKTEQK